MKRRTRTLLIIIAAVVVLGALVVANLARKPEGVPVETRAAAYGSILSKVSATGELKAEAQVNLQAQVMGVVARLYVKEGDRVRSGDVLLELDRKSYEAALVSARSHYTQARLSFARLESLHAAKLVSSEAWEAGQAAFDMARAQFEQAQDQYDKTVLRAPISGTVVQINIKEGETVIIGTMNNPGTVLMVIADMSRMQAIVDVDETDIVRVATGQKATVEVDALPDTSFSGTVTRVGYMPSAQSLLSTATVKGTTFEVEITLDSTAPRLRPGMNVHADIVTAELDSVLTIPIQAAGRRDIEGRETETVFLVKDGKAVLTPVRTGKSSDSDIEVREGLSPGDIVITGPYKTLSKLEDGRRVTIKPAPEKKASP
uniref:Efflux RND transporter periplasmic adaptor subunit n=1 Tax=candidate division WOR-3 bacterium TaxID=2052148 RepID=A0A7C4GG82_UNCW3